MRTLFGRSWTVFGLLALPLVAIAENQPVADGLFAQLDANEDGQITRDEVPEEKQALFDRLLRESDKDGNSQLNPDELAAGLASDRPERPLEEKAEAAYEAPQLPDPEEMFARLDQDNDGKIAKDEVPEDAREHVEQLMQNADDDNDGALSKDEVKAAFAKIREKFSSLGGGPPTPEKMLERLDANGDGKLTKDEIPAGAEGLKKVLKKADTNNDEAVTKEELEYLGKKFQKLTRGFQDPEDRPSGDSLAQGPPGPPPGGRPDGPPGPPNPEEMFRHIDANGDGSISKEEFAEHHKQMRERFGDRRPGGPEGRERRGGDRPRRPDGEGGPGHRPEGPPPPRDREDGPPRGPEGRRGPHGPFDSPEEFFKRTDKNNDGKLTADEASDEGKQRFERMLEHQDKDGDKAISQEEFAEGARRMRERFHREGGPGGPEDRRRRPGGPDGPPQPEGPPGPPRPESDDQSRGSGRQEFGGPRVRARFAGEQRREGGPPMMGPVAIFRLLNSNGDDRLDDAELAAAGIRLARLDRDRDGTISPRELFVGAGGRGGNRRPGSSGPPPEEWRRPDGSKHERFGPPRGDRDPRSPGELADRPHWQPMAHRDGDHDGPRTRPHDGGRKTQGMHRHPFYPGKMMERMTAAIDGDKDGKVTFQEFTVSQKKRFDNLDANKDGVIDEAERKQAAEKMTARMKQFHEKMRSGKHRGDGARQPEPPPGQSGSIESPTEVPPPEPA